MLTEPEAPQSGKIPWRRFSATLLAAFFVICLAVAAVFWPRDGRRASAERFVVLDPLVGLRGAECYEPLARLLSTSPAGTVQLVVCETLAEIADLPREEIALLLVPDAVALGLPRDDFVSLAVGRRHSPENLRSPSVLVRRLDADVVAQPWLSHPHRTILADSLSLAGCGVLLRNDRDTRPVEVRDLNWGADPFDHSAVLHTLRLGCFDYAVVSAVAAERFRAAGLLSAEVWGISDLTMPLPGTTLFVTRRWTRADRLLLGEMLLGLGRQPDAVDPEEVAVLAGLQKIGLAGFNLLLEPDFELVRRRFDGRWPGKAF